MEEGTKREPQEPKAVGVTFRRGGKVYSFAPNGVRVTPGDRVLAKTERGVDIGEVVVVKKHLDRDERDKPLKPLVRRATRDDVRREERLREREREAEAVCNKKIAEHSLPMKLIDADYTFDGQRLVFFFSAEGRVDFRALVRDLAETFHCRIELRQIGVRDEAKMIGGLGPCGRPLCCAQWLRTFDPVGIKVAKDQGMPLNPAKISGICDRLMCCLRFEHEVYKELAARLPQSGDEVRSQGKVGVVKGVALLREMVTVQFADSDGLQVMEVPAADLRKMRGHWLLISGQAPAAAQAPGPRGAAEARPAERPSAPRRSARLEEAVPEATMREPRRGRRSKPTEPEPAGDAPEPQTPESVQEPERPAVPATPEDKSAGAAEGTSGEKKRRRGRRKRRASATGQEGAGPAAAGAESAGPQGPPAEGAPPATPRPRRRPPTQRGAAPDGEPPARVGAAPDGSEPTPRRPRTERGPASAGEQTGEAQKRPASRRWRRRRPAKPGDGADGAAGKTDGGSS